MFIGTNGIMAQTAENAFIDMPDTLFTCLTKEARAEVVGLKKLDMDSSVVYMDRTGKKTELMEMSDDYLRFEHSEGMTWEIAMLQNETGDTLICLLKTLNTPEPDTRAYIYNKVWEKQATIDFLQYQLTQKNDTLTDAEYEERLNLVDLKIVEAHLIGDHKTLQLTQHFPMTSTEERKKLEAVSVTKKLRWNGKTFVEE